MVCFCGGKVYALSLCNKHYRRLKKYGDPNHSEKPRGTLADRFWSKVDKDPVYQGCWAWVGGKSTTGYGIIQEGGRGSKNLSAHRLSYELGNGPVPDGLYILHACDNRWCVNPDHLRAGTAQENIQEAFDKRRKVSPFSEAKNRKAPKLTAEQAEYVKAHPEMKHTELAEKLSVSPNCIRSIRIGRTWRE